MYIQKIESDLATVSLSVVELALLTQACGVFTVKKGTSAEQALVESMGAGFHGAAMAASSIDVLLGEDVDRVQRQWQRNGLLRAADGSVIHHVKTLDELRETLVGKDVFVDAAHYEGFGTVEAVLSDGVVQVETGHTGALIVVGTDEMVELNDADGVRYNPADVAFSSEVNDEEQAMVDLIEEAGDNLLTAVDTFVKAVS